MVRADIILISQPAIDFGTLLSISADALGYSPAAKADACYRELADAERFLSYLAAIRQKDAEVGFEPNLLGHVHFSALLASTNKDLLSIFTCCAGMSVVTTETKIPGLQLSVLSGTLAQWRDAAVSGTNNGGAAQECFCKVLSQFEEAGIAVWGNYTKTHTPNGLFLLEDRR